MKQKEKHKKIAVKLKKEALDDVKDTVKGAVDGVKDAFNNDDKDRR